MITQIPELNLARLFALDADNVKMDPERQSLAQATTHPAGSYTTSQPNEGDEDEDTNQKDINH